MGARTRAKIGTAEGVKTVRVYSANPKTVDGYNTFIFRRDIARSLSKLAWAPVIDGSRNPVLEGVEIGDRSVRYSADDKRRLIEFVERIADAQKGAIENDDFGHFEITKIFATEVQCHAISTRREIESVSSAAEIARRLIHFAGSPNEEQKRKKPNKYFEYGLAKIRLSDGVYLVMGEVGIRVNKRPYYNQRVVAKFKADSEVSSLHGQTQIGESTFEQVYDNRFRLILQGVELYYKRSPKFSIIIPVYNVAPYLRECLDSVLAQTFTDWEAICVDDGSTDGSGDILNELADKDARIKVLHQTNSGVSVARNCGLENAIGDWIGFVDSDDVVDADWLSCCREAIANETSCDSIVWGFQSFNDSQAINLGADSSISVGNKDLWRNMFRKEVVGGVRFANLVRGEDILFVKMCQDRSRSTCDLQKKLYAYRVRMGSLLHSPLDLRKAKDEIAWRLGWLKLMRDSKRVYSLREFRSLALCLTEGVASIICTADADVLHQVSLDWFALLSEAKEVKRFSLWFRFAMALVSRTNSIALAWGLFYFPHWLKKKGVHR